MDTYNYDDETREILRASYMDEIKKTEIHIFDYETAAAIFNISEEDLLNKIDRIESIARREGFKKGFAKCFDDNTINIVGMYLLCFYNKENSTNPMFNRYLQFFSDKTNFFTVKLLGNLLSDRTERRYSNAGRESNVDWETAAEYQVTKGIDGNLKKPKEDVEDKEHFFYKKAVVITGSFDSFPLRNDMAKLLHDCGANVNSAISKKTDYVIVGKDAGPKKLEKIAELNIQVIDEGRFLEIFPK